MKRLSFVSVLVVFLFVGLNSSAQAITYGTEISNASVKYSSVISIWTDGTILGDKSFICTGNVISPVVVLTAAHCVLPKSEGHLYVGYGADRLDEVSTFSDVSASWIHPRYSHNLFVNDIGLLLLPSPLPHELVNPLPSAQGIFKALKSARGNFEIAGWGVDQNGESSTYLRHSFVNDQTLVAQKIKGWNNKVWLAVGKYNKTERIYSGACNGDSGGPLYAIVGSVKTLIGITSWGASDCEIGRPSIYSRLSYYLDEIKIGMVQLKINEKTDNRLPPPTFITTTQITGPTSSSDLKSSNTYSCVPAKAGPNDKIVLGWFWINKGQTGKFISQNNQISISIDDLKANSNGDSIWPNATLNCNTVATGPGGLHVEDSSTIYVKLDLPPRASVSVPHAYDPGFSYANPSTCTVNDNYPGQTIKWFISSSPSAVFPTDSYPSDAIVVSNGPIFRYTMQNIALFSGKWLYCSVERRNAVGISISSVASTYTWPADPAWFLAHPGILPTN